MSPYSWASPVRDRIVQACAASGFACTTKLETYSDAVVVEAVVKHPHTRTVEFSVEGLSEVERVKVTRVRCDENGLVTTEVDVFRTMPPKPMALVSWWRRLRDWCAGR
jgi:hypothetical protein